MFRKILVPLSPDPRERSEKTMQTVFGLQPEEIILLHVLESVPEIIGGKDRKHLDSDEQDQARSLFDEILRLTGICVPCRTILERGAPDAAIVRVAERENVDLIVMFSSGRDNMQEMLIGSCTERVLRSTNTPLLVLK